MNEFNKSQRLLDITEGYLESIDRLNPPEPYEVTEAIIKETVNAYSLRNAAFIGKDAAQLKWRIPDALEPAQIAKILAYLHTIKRVSCTGNAADSEYDLLAVYQEDGPEKGIYSTQDVVMEKLMREYQPTLTTSQIREVKSALSTIVQRVTRCDERNLVPVNNGIFDYDTKQLLPFSPDKVFLTKCRVDYVPNAVSLVIHNAGDNTDWELEQWMRDLSDDPGVPELLWEIIGAAIRPNVRWDKSAWFYAQNGNNGKGTLCALIRNICGKGNHAALKLDDFSKDFALEPLIRVSAIITDENEMDVYLDKVANLKAIITNDTIQVNRKFKTAIAYQFRGFMIQCVNSMPKIKDKSDSFYRRQLCVPFRKCFTGKERRYIKEDYLCRKEVLEYALWRVMNMNYYELSEPDACKMMLSEYKEYNDPMRQFWNEFEYRFTWDLLPFTFLYDLYKVWIKSNAPESKIPSKTGFTNNLANVVAGSTEWAMPEKGPDGKYRQKRRGKLMDKVESLIVEYKLENWADKSYKGYEENQRYRPNPATLQNSYRGLIRTSCPNENKSAAELQADSEKESGTSVQAEHEIS